MSADTNLGRDPYKNYVWIDRIDRFSKLFKLSIPFIIALALVPPNADNISALQSSLSGPRPISAQERGYDKGDTDDVQLAKPLVIDLPPVPTLEPKPKTPVLVITEVVEECYPLIQHQKKLPKRTGQKFNDIYFEYRPKKADAKRTLLLTDVYDRKEWLVGNPYLRCGTRTIRLDKQRD